MRIKNLLNKRTLIGIWFVGSLVVAITLLISIIVRTEVQNISLTSYQVSFSTVVFGNMLAAGVGVWNINTLIDIAKNERRKRFILPRIDEMNKVA